MTSTANSIEAYRLFHEGILALQKAEHQGIRMDMNYYEKVKDELTVKIKDLEYSFKETNFYKKWVFYSDGKGVNIHSPIQLSNYLFKNLKLKTDRFTDSGKESSDEETLSQLNIPELNDLLHIRKLKKIKDTYIEGFIREAVNGVIHPFFNLHLVKTFRSSSDSPNFQNIPKRDKEAKSIIRQGLYAREGNHLMAIDFSGVEVRIAACYHKDPTMIKYITDPTSDMHGDMAKQIFKINKFDRSIPEYKVLRNAAKNGFVFPQFYGDYYKNCANNLANNWGKLPKGKWKPGQGIPMPNGTLSDHLIEKGINSFDKFTQHLEVIEKDFWGKRFPVYRDWKETWYKKYQRYGYVDSFTGFRFSGAMKKNDVINYPIQSAAFHCLLWSFIQITKQIEKYNLKSRLIGQIHDEAVLDVPPNEVNTVKDISLGIMEKELPKNWDWIIVPITVEIELSKAGGSWNTMEKLE